ncbi:unnamed protein product [Closterium sp. NIES-54]
MLLQVSGGREGRPIGAFELAQAVEQLGAGEILLNCIDCDGECHGMMRRDRHTLCQAQGFDLNLVGLVSSAVSIAVMASRAAAQASQSTVRRSLLTQAPLLPPSHGRSGPGFDLDLVGLVSWAVSIPVIASSGAGTPEHFSQGQGFDLDLVELVSSAVSIPVIASSGAGIPEHFSQVFAHTGASAALAAGIFHRNEVTIESVKTHLAEEGVETRLL